MSCLAGHIANMQIQFLLYKLAHNWKMKFKKPRQLQQDKNQKIPRYKLNKRCLKTSTLKATNFAERN